VPQNMDLPRVIVFFVPFINYRSKIKAELDKLFQHNIIQYDYELNLSLSVQTHLKKFF